MKEDAQTGQRPRMKLNEYICIGGHYHGEILSGMHFSWVYDKYNHSVKIARWTSSAYNFEWLKTVGYGKNEDK